MFSLRRGKVDKIWMRARRVARRDRFGHSLARGIAVAAGCYVVASTEYQTHDQALLPYGQHDTFEGLVLGFGPDGRVTWQHRYRSTYQLPDGNWSHNPG